MASAADKADHALSAADRSLAAMREEAVGVARGAEIEPLDRRAARLA